jgi:hypothetical protein
VRDGLAELGEKRLVTWVRYRTNHYELKALTLERWIQTPKELLRGSLRVGPKLTYLAINTFDVWGMTGVGAYPRRRQLREILLCSESGLRGWLDELQKAALLRVEDDGQYVLYKYAQQYQWDPCGGILDQLPPLEAEV